MARIKIKKFGKYKLLKQIAKGGMAEIFLACVGSIKSAPKFVVIKRIICTQSNNKEFNKMFQNEGRIATNLNHSNIASIHEFGMENEQFFICMEYISGRNLRQLVKKLHSRKQQLGVEECAHIIKTACLGVDYAHNCTDSVTGQPLNIIHRDISPQNIMISFNGDIKVIDFGIAKIDDSEATKVGVLKGKFEYMSPEQVRGRTLDRQTDVFSMGCILWELLTGKKLFTGSDPMHILKKIKACNIPNLKGIRPDLPDRIVEITLRSLHPNKNMRYTTMDEFASDLTVFLNKQYPHWTQNRFGSFIKKVYIEEILEERNHLKLCAQKLEADGLPRKWSFLTNKSNGYEDSQLDSDTFMSSPEDVQGDAQMTGTLTQGDPAGSITKTEFDDSLEQQILLKKSKILNTGEYFTGNSIQTCSEQEAFKRYNPYSSGILFGGRKKARNRKPLGKYIAYAVCTMILIGGFCLVKFGVIKEFPHLSFLDIFTTEGRRSIAVDPKGEEHPPKKVIPPPVQPKRDIQAVPSPRPLNQKKVRKVFLDTEPSGVKFYIDGGKKISGVTPVWEDLPVNRRFTLTLKKAGFLDKQVVVTPAQVRKGRLVYVLDRKKAKKAEFIIINN